MLSGGVVDPGQLVAPGRRSSRCSSQTADGKPIKLAPGTTWVELPDVSYAVDLVDARRPHPRAEPTVIDDGAGIAASPRRGPGRLGPMSEPRATGTARVKRGLAEMLRGGVIMDVVNAEQARIAEDAGAVAVMALERVPADIRRDGGVARMSDPAMIEEIQAAVTIPVMAKCRIGHFAEAQVLESLGVDYIDESEVLTPADEAHHVDKWAFTSPFVCGATNLGEALRRISEGACMIRSKGEAGTGNIVEAVRHLRTILGDIKKLTVAEDEELYAWAEGAAGSGRPGPGGRRARRAAGPAVLRRRHRDPGRRVARDAARRAGGVRRLRHLQERRPGSAGQGDRRGDHALRRRRDRGQGVAWPRPDAMKGEGIEDLDVKLAGPRLVVSR